MPPRPPGATLFPYTTLFRSCDTDRLYVRPLANLDRREDHIARRDRSGRPAGVDEEPGDDRGHGEDPDRQWQEPFPGQPTPSRRCGKVLLDVAARKRDRENVEDRKVLLPRPEAGKVTALATDVEGASQVVS